MTAWGSCSEEPNWADRGRCTLESRSIDTQRVITHDQTARLHHALWRAAVASLAARSAGAAGADSADRRADQRGRGRPYSRVQLGRAGERLRNWVGRRAAIFESSFDLPLAIRADPAPRRSRRSRSPPTSRNRGLLWRRE